MFRLFGLLALGNLIFGGGHHHRQSGRHLGKGILLGALLGFLWNKGNAVDHVEGDIRETVRKAQKAARKAVKKAKKEIRDARKTTRDKRIAEHLEAVHEEIAARKAARTEHMSAVRQEIEACKAQSRQRQANRNICVKAVQAGTGNESEEIQELVEDLERNARTAAMASSVPTIQFPEDDEKYHSARKYEFAR